MSIRFTLSVSAGAAAFAALTAFTAPALAGQLQLATNTSKCLVKQDAGFSNGNPAVLGTCESESSEDKSWYWDSSTHYIHSSADPTKCLHKKYGNNWDNGNPIHLWDCSAGALANKTWDIDSSTGYIKAHYNTAKCIHKKYGDTNDGNPIHLWDCSAGSAGNKTWSYQSATLDSSVAEECTGSNAAPAQVYDDSDTYGNSTVGASYFLVAGIADKDLILDPLPPPERAYMDSILADDYVWIGGRGEVEATLFGDSDDILVVEASGTQNDGDLDSRVLLEVMGATLIDAPIGVSYNWSTDVTFFSASASFYGVTVTGELVGTLGFDASAYVGATGVAVDATPFADVTATAQAGIGGWCVSAGAGADLTIIGVEIPVDGQMMLVGNDIAWDLDASVEMSTLDGSIYLYVDYCIDSEEYEIFSWDGISLPTIELFNLSGCI